jgi:small conductance mechanosensitive channel
MFAIIDQLNGFERTATLVTILIGTVILERILRWSLHRYFESHEHHIKVDPTQYAFLKHLASATIYIIGIGLAIYTIPSLRALSVSLFAGAGVIAVIIGFASQQAFSNVISGIFIALFKPFRVGDKVKIKETVAGYVEDITLRHTVIRDFENKRIIIPNSVISNEIVENAHIGDEKICKHVNMSISYDANIDKAMKIMQREAMKHPNFLDNRTSKEKREKEPVVPARVIGFGDFSVHLRAWVWTANPTTAWRMGCDLNKSIKESFDKEGIEIPYPHRTIVYKKDIKKDIKKEIKKNSKTKKKNKQK